MGGNALAFFFGVLLPGGASFEAARVAASHRQREADALADTKQRDTLRISKLRVDTAPPVRSSAWRPYQCEAQETLEPRLAAPRDSWGVGGAAGQWRGRGGPNYSEPA